MHLSTEDTSHEVACCVILAAGEGRRLSTENLGRPKPTTEILGLSLGERIMLACMAAGVHRFVVVLGSQADAVRAQPLRFRGPAAAITPRATTAPSG